MDRQDGLICSVGTRFLEPGASFQTGFWATKLIEAIKKVKLNSKNAFFMKELDLLQK